LGEVAKTIFPKIRKSVVNVLPNRIEQLGRYDRDIYIGFFGEGAPRELYDLTVQELRGRRETISCRSHNVYAIFVNSKLSGGFRNQLITLFTEDSNVAVINCPFKEIKTLIGADHFLQR